MQIKMICKRCKYEWNTRSQAQKRICCPHCKTSITKLSMKGDSTKVSISLSLAEQLNKFMLARMIGMARGNGEDQINFKVKNGMIEL